MTTANLAAALAKFVPQDVLADLLNCTLGAEACPQLSDAEVELVAEFHDCLCYEAPVAMDLAARR